MPTWYIWVLFAVFVAVVFITAESMRRTLRSTRKGYREALFDHRNRLRKLDQDLKWWKEAHIKLQNQVIRGREIMYDQLMVSNEDIAEVEEEFQDDEIYASVKCQSCQRNKVIIKKDEPYFGIICQECRNKRPSWVKDK